ncbi:MAG TPA: hypothetical protein VGD83_16515, partial [Streptosporangiaceae bacterium]
RDRMRALRAAASSCALAVWTAASGSAAMAPRAWPPAGVRPPDDPGLRTWGVPELCLACEVQR